MTTDAIRALRDSDALIRSAQAILTDYLVPDGPTTEDALGNLLLLLDGPRQREVQAQTASVLAPQTPAPDLVAEPVDFCFVWTKDGHVPRRAHHREDAALREAERLARKNPGRKFIVLRAIHKIHFPSKLKETE